jgi:soluble lytic murein transglycosylase
MSTPPLPIPNEAGPSPRVKRAIAGTAALLAIAALIYSGTAWIWLRPVLHKPLINQYAAEYRFDPLWIMALIRVESRFAANAHSPRGAIGLMQLLPSTARDIAPELGLRDIDEATLRQPAVNLHLGCHYLSKLKRLFPDDEVAVLAAYNAGPGITQQWRRGKPSLDLQDIEYPETRRFVRQVQLTYTYLKSLQRWKHLFGID